MTTANMFGPRKGIKHKFRAIPTERDGIKFASKKEANYYDTIKYRQQMGEVLFFLRQVPIHLPGGTKLVVDFVEFRTDDTVHFIDTKGIETDSFKIKRREVEALYPIKIETV